MASVHLDKLNRVHFVGIGGIGMSGLARFLVSEKKQVSGSDRALTPLTKTLVAEGIQVMSPQTDENINSDIELVIYTEAITEGSDGWDELAAARALGIPTISYFVALGLAMNPYYLIAVAGTHGKTTTTAMLVDIFEAAGKDPTAIVGSLRSKTKSNFRAGKSKYAIVEACEYKRDFLFLKPDVLVITNLEYDHVDYYDSLAAVQVAFTELVERVHETGVIIANTNDPAVAPVLENAAVPVKNYLEALDLELALKQPGLHNRMNAAAATAVAQHEKLSVDSITSALHDFSGTWRRFEYKGEYQGAPVYDDYAHHPTALRATIDAARELYPDRRLVVVFQPHTYSRTAKLFDEFAKALGLADMLVLLPIYEARETNESGVSSRELSVKALEFISDVYYAPDQAAALAKLQEGTGSGDVIFVLGAGTVTELADALTK